MLSLSIAESDDGCLSKAVVHSFEQCQNAFVSCVHSGSLQHSKLEQSCRYRMQVYKCVHRHHHLGRCYACGVLQAEVYQTHWFYEWGNHDT